MIYIKIDLYANDLYEAKYQLLINKRESVGSNHCNNCETFTEYFHGMNNIYENINEYNSNTNMKNIVFEDIVDMLRNKKN